jgi:hypothetical protein
VSLSGYGVELTIKSTEYKAIDDADAKNSASGEEEAPTNLHGFNFKLSGFSVSIKIYMSICAINFVNSKCICPNWMNWLC